jgi:hypothetical protein
MVKYLKTRKGQFYKLLKNGKKKEYHKWNIGRRKQEKRK